MDAKDEKAELKKQLELSDQLDAKGLDEKAPTIDAESTEEKVPYPRSIPFIISNELCERFSFYGMRTVLSIYLAEKLLYSDDSAVVIYHVWTMFVYFFPIFGAIIADSWLGRFRTIFYLSIVYALGSILIAVTSIPTLGIPDRAFTMVGLVIVAIGTGGIKPCVSAFGGDQFKLPQQERQLASFFSLFYFSINAGSFVSTFITPILRKDVQCYGGDCYPLAFGVPGILMIVSIVIFVLGKSLYVIKNPTGNVLVNVFKCISHALSRKKKLKKIEKKEHWLDYADDKYSTEEISGIRATLNVLLIFVPLPIFWALFDQQGSRWTFQATRMDGGFGGSFSLKPDQMQVVNPLLILLFIPLFEVAIYPAFKWCHFLTKPLHKLIAGGVLAAIAFIISAVVELQLENTYPILPREGNGQIRIYNGYDCDVTITSMGETFILNSTYSVYENRNIEVDGTKQIPYTIETDCPNFKPPKVGNWDAEEKKAISYFLNDTMARFEDDPDKKKGEPAIRVLRNFYSPSNLTFMDPSDPSDRISISTDDLGRYDMKATTYNTYLGGELIGKDLKLALGAVYTVIARKRSDGYVLEQVEIAPSNSVHMLWLLPQYIVMTAAEVMFSVTGLEFAFTQAPPSMKSVLTAGWLLTMAFGNLIVVIIAEVKIFESQANEFFLFAGLMLVDMVIFWLMTFNYKYIDVSEASRNEQRKEALALEEKAKEKESLEKEKEGIDNEGMVNDETPNQ